MPKDLFEIRSFDKGIALSVDPNDLNENAASYSKNVDPFTISGEVVGIPEDISQSAAFVEPIASAVVYENSGANTHRAVTYDADGEDVYEAAGIEESGTPTFTIATGGANISSDGEPVFTSHAGKVYMGMGSSATKYPYIYEYVDGRVIPDSSIMWGTYANPNTNITDQPNNWLDLTDGSSAPPWEVAQGYQVNKAFRNPGYPIPIIPVEYPDSTVPLADILPAVFCKSVSGVSQGTYPELPVPAAGRYYLYYSIVYTTGEESPLYELYQVSNVGAISHANTTLSTNQVIEIDTLMIAFPYDTTADRKFPDNAYSIRIYLGEADTNAETKEKSVTIPRLGIEIVQSEVTALTVVASDITVTGYTVSGGSPSAGTYQIIISGTSANPVVVGEVDWSGSWDPAIRIYPIDPRHARGYTSTPSFQVYDPVATALVSGATVAFTSSTYTFLAPGLYLVPRTGPDIASSKVTISTLGPTYDANAGFSYLRNFSIVHWNLATQVNGTHVVADVYNPELPEEALEWERYLLKSQPYAYGTFDWANDFVILKDKPTALASYAGRVYAFGESWFQRINPDPLFVEDTYDGIGCMGKSAVLETELGLFWASETSIYMLDGSGIKDIGTPIKISTGLLSLTEEYEARVSADGGTTASSGNVADVTEDLNSLGLFNDPSIIVPCSSGKAGILYSLIPEKPAQYGWSEVDKGRVVVGFDAKRNAVIFIATGPSLAWVYSIGQERWDFWSAPQDIWSACISPEGHTILFSDSTYYHYLQHATNKRVWRWDSGNISMGEPSYEKFMHRVYYSGSGSTSVNYSLDKGSSYTGPIISPALVPQGTSGSKSIKIKATGTGTDSLDNLGITYRRKVK